MNTLDFLKYFCIEPGSMRKQMKNPFLSDWKGKEYYIATDTEILIMFPISNVKDNISIGAINDSPKFKHILDNLNYRSEYKPISIKEIDIALAKIPLTDDAKKCENCDGEGEVECHCCSNDMTCSDCDGNGYIPSKNGKKIPDIDSIFTIEKAFFRSKMLLGIKKIIDFIDAKSISILAGTDTSAYLFKIDDVYFLCMPCSQFEKDEHFYSFK